MSHKALTPGAGCKQTSKPPFNEVADSATEIEIKFLVPREPNAAITRTTFDNIKSYFESRGWIRSSHEVTGADGPGSLITRQLDTPDMALYNKGVTVRVRGNCPDGNMKSVGRADVCVKLGSTTNEKSGALHRREFQAPIDDFGRVDFAPLFAKYPKDQYPELHEALKDIDPKQLVERARPDVIRHRYVVELPDTVTGLPGKKFFGELILDEVAFVFDPKPQKNADKTGYLNKTGPVVYYVDQEVECENLDEPDEYDTDPNAASYVSSPMSTDEQVQAMTAMRDQIMAAAEGHLVPNQESKAERCFRYLKERLALWEDCIKINKLANKGSKIQSAFALAHAANDNPPVKLHHRLPEDFGAYLRKRALPIARHPG